MKTPEIFQKDYPYVTTRVRVRGTKLLDRNDYDNLLKMGPNEISRKLEEGQYEEEINELGSQLEGVPLVESALELNAATTLKELVELCPEGLAEVLQVYIRRYELQSIKRILRWKKTGEKESIRPDLVPGITYDLEDLERLSEKSYDEILQDIEFDGLVDYQSYLEGKEDIKDVEKSLDQAYFDELQKLSDKVGSRDFSEFIKAELEYENLRIILRLKKYGVEREEIEQKIFKDGFSDLVEKSLDAENLDELKEVLEDSKWNVDVTKDVEEIEHGLDVERLRNARKNLRGSPLGVVPIVAYVVAKMTEVKNLRTLIQAKATGIQSDEEIRENLVIE